jgi:transposase
MMKRKRYSAEFKAKVALEAIREELTTADLAKKHGVHPTMISGWKKTAIKNMAQAFGAKAEEGPPISPKDVEKLHAKIGQLVVERDFLADASSLILGTGQGYRIWIFRPSNENIVRTK